MKELSNQSIKDRALAGTLRGNECGNPDLCEFLKSLKKPQSIANRCPDQTNEEMFAKAVKQSKKRSMSLIFSVRTHAVCEYAMLNQC